MKKWLWRLLAGAGALAGSFGGYLYWESLQPKPMRPWKANPMYQDVGPMPKPGDFPATEERLDLAVAPKEDLYPAVRGDPENAPSINRTLLIKGEMTLQDPFVAGTRPAGPDEESDERKRTRR